MCEKFGITADQLPLIKITDQGLAGLEAVAGSVIRILRRSPVTGKEEPYYRKAVE